MKKDEPQISSSTLQDLRAVAACYKHSFPSSLSSAMGETYLKKMLEWYVAREYTFLFHAIVDGRVAGFCGGIYRTQPGMEGSASGMAQHSFRQAVASFAKKPWLLFHREMINKYPFALKNLARRFWKKKRPTTPSPDFQPVASLVVIGVDPVFRNRHVGSALMKEFETRSAAKGIPRMLLTVRSDNAAAMAMYRRSGWTADRTEGASTQMLKVLRSNPDG